MKELDKIIAKHTEGNYLFSNEAKRKMKADILKLFNVKSRGTCDHDWRELDEGYTLKCKTCGLERNLT